jgi:regulatory protein
VTSRRPSHDRPPLDAESLERLAVAYVGRFATSRAGLIRYLKRKLAERGFTEGEPAVEALADRFATLGYVDDRALADARGRSLARRGYGARRVSDVLRGLGIADADAAEAREEATANAWQTALRYAERRRFGPFADRATDEVARRRAFAAMVRAGHSPEHARKIIVSPPGTIPKWDE